MSEEFYVGYMKQAPKILGRFIRSRVIMIFLLVAAAAGGIALTQKNVHPVTFEFGNLRSFEGVIHHAPYPHLLVERPNAEDSSRYPLVAPGKFGADELTRAFDSVPVTLEGSLIYKDTVVMIEVKPDSIQAAGPKVETTAPKRLGIQSFEGEIVDSKCYLGVMNPGNTKTHKACAIRCISGGIPPVLLVRDDNGMATYLMLVDEDGQAVNDRVLHQIAEPVRITGQVEQMDNLLILRANPDTYENL